MISIKLRRFIARYLVGIVKLVYRIKFQFLNFANYPPVIILTPGKVGSSSIYSTLKSHIPNPVFHIHHISEQGIESSIEEHVASDRKSIPLHLIISRLLRKKLLNYGGNKYIICIVREPVSREISAFFQNTEFYKSIVEENNLQIETNASISILNNIFRKNITSHLENWFKTEINIEFGLDVFSAPFSNKKGYHIFRNGKTSLLLLKMETMNNVFSKAMKEFLKFDTDYTIQSSNIAEQKHYALTYSEILQSFKLSEEQLSEIIQSEYFQHFYHVEEQKIREKWL